MKNEKSLQKIADLNEMMDRKRSKQSTGLMMTEETLETDARTKNDNFDSFV
jgi:hypothetical protein